MIVKSMHTRMKRNMKISSTAYRVMLLLKLLNENNFSIEALNMALSQDPNISRTFSTEVILKYLSTLRYAGYKISKPNIANNYTYKLIKAPLHMQLSEEEMNALVAIDSFVSNMHQKVLQDAQHKIMENISRYLNDEQINQLHQLKKSTKFNYATNSKFSKYASLMSKFEQYCIDDQKIVIKYKNPIEENEIQITLEPKYLDYVGGDIYICGYNPIIGERKLINLDYIIDIKQLPVRSSNNYILSPVIFKLKDRLAKVYELHENEKITETDTETYSITITTYVDCKNMLMQRLLKYGDLCEVLYPKAFREKIANELSTAIRNYE